MHRWDVLRLEALDEVPRVVARAAFDADLVLGVALLGRLRALVGDPLGSLLRHLLRVGRLRFIGRERHGEPNQVVLRIDPNPGLQEGLISRDTGERGWRAVHLEMTFARELGPPLEPYERLLRDAMAGDNHLFTREDGVEETWRIVQPLLDHAPPVVPYAQGSWGPPEAAKLVNGYAEWHEPWLPADADSTNGGHDASH